MDKVVCVNCRDAHVAGYQRCPMRERQVEVARVRVLQKVSYARAVNKVEELVRDPARIEYWICASTE